MIILIFLLAAAVVVGAAIYLNQFGDVISKKSSLSGAVVGTFLIAGATSLPELTTSLTAVYIDNPDIAVGNMLGSNVFNLLILAVVDLIYRKRRLFQKINTKANVPSALIGLLFLIILIVSLLIPGTISLFGVGIEMIVIVLLYVLSMKYISSDDGEQEEVPTKDYSLRTAVIGFIVAALIVFVSGSILSISGDRLAEATGMNASFVGSFLIAASTSLPELVTVLAAFKLANYNMAIGSILGSNLFNIQLLVLTDVLYRDGPILSAVGYSHIYTAILGVVMTLVIVYLLLRPSVIRNQWRYAAPSLVMALLYIVASYIMF
ncbi:sodium:calcium antiporter [Guptibacillus hwajinpoensis]|uniref:Cation:H+ antiporter n=1 Tax=Guptibacillus hwajinpoensis TaxID=208199 RepID=A0ABU0K645_9BACL|nr:sodium:calcium antiporter [Alkalihalobacillus hemicentroti]MDQ0483818.1 cation:H+ antiporter [Alkalihalobacillus hemicentroti]